MKYKEELEKLKKEKEECARSNRFYKEENNRLMAEKKVKEEEIKKRYSVIVYCKNCLEVSSCSFPPGIEISQGDCVVCRVKQKLLLVKKVNGGSYD